MKPKSEMQNWIVLFREEDADFLSEPLAFVCLADDMDHAEEQCVNAYPGCDIVWSWCGYSIDEALEDYNSSGLYSR